MGRESAWRFMRLPRFCRYSLASSLILPACALSVSAQTPTTSTANTPHAAMTWHGVNVASRELVLGPEPDLCLGGPMPLCFGRYYASLLEGEGEAVSSLGSNWLGTYDWHFEETALDARVVDNRGRVYHFIKDANGWTLDYPRDAPWQLTDIGPEMSFAHVRHRAFYIIDRSTAKLVRIEDGKGNQHTLSYSRGLLQNVSDGLGRELSFAHDEQDRVIEVSDGIRLRVYGYSGANLTEVTDAAFKVTTYQYDEASATPGLLTGWIDPVGNSPLTYSYDQGGRVAQVHDGVTTLATFTVISESPEESLILVEAPDGGLHQYTHDALGQLTLYGNPANGSTTWTYDPLGRLTSVTRPSGIHQPAMFEYDPVDNYLNKVTLGDGLTYEFIAERRTFIEGHFLFPTVIQAPDVSQIQLDYDAVGNLSQVTDQAQHSWSMTHNAFGQTTSITNPTSGVHVITYDPGGRLETLNDGGGTTTFFHDNLDRLTDVLHPDLSSEILTYDDRNLLLSYTNELSKTWSYEYRDNGQLFRVTNPLTVATEFDYDAMNRLILAGVPTMGSLITYGYDTSWRIQTVTDPTFRTLSYEYDQLGQLTKVTDPDGEETTYAYDVDGRLTSTTDPLSHTWIFGYDLRDRLTTLTDPLNQITTYGYDAVSNLTSVDRPLILSRTYGYDARGLLTSASLGPITVGYFHTPLGLLDTFTDGEQNPWSRSYDAHGRLQSTTDPLTRTISYEYDTRNRLTDVTHQEGSATYAHDDVGHLTQASYSDGTIFNYTYDDVGRLLTTDGVTRTYDELGRVTEENDLTYTYDEAGRLLTETLGPNQVVTHTYDSRGLLGSTTDWLQGATTFTHDVAGRLTGIDRPNGTSAQYSYDDGDRLVGLTERGQGGNVVHGSVSLTRDALGRVTAASRQMPHTWGPATAGENFAYDPASQVVGFNYDGLGRLLDGGLRSYVWDGASLPDSIDDGTENRDMDPDGLGRVKVQMPSLDPSTPYVQFIHSPPTGSVVNPLPSTGGMVAEDAPPAESRVPERLPHRDRAVTGADFGNLATSNPGVKITRASVTPTGPGTVRAHWITTPGGLLLHSIDLRDQAPERRYFHFDERGNTAFQTNDAGNVVNAYAYSVQGEVSRIGETQQYPRFTYGGAFGVVQESADGLYRWGSSFYDAHAPATFQPERRLFLEAFEDGGGVRGFQRLESGLPTLPGPDDPGGLSPVWRLVIPRLDHESVDYTLWSNDGRPIRAKVGGSGSGGDWLAELFEVFQESRKDVQEGARYWLPSGGPLPAAKIRPLQDRIVLAPFKSSSEERPVVVLPGGLPSASSHDKFHRLLRGRVSRLFSTGWRFPRGGAVTVWPWPGVEPPRILLPFPDDSLPCNPCDEDD